MLSWLPARITALLLASLNGVGWRDLAREAVKTPSPNSGWPMAAMALALGVALRKPGVYVLNPGGRTAMAADTSKAIFYASNTLVALVLIALVALVFVVFVGRA